MVDSAKLALGEVSIHLKEYKSFRDSISLHASIFPVSLME